MLDGRNESEAIKPNIDLTESKSLFPKYHQDAPFTDPIIRCNNCGNLDMTEKWKKRGHCKKCGNRRCRNVLNMGEEDRAKAVAWGVDPDFLALFEAVSDDDD
jgi:hypothetical protein